MGAVSSFCALSRGEVVVVFVSGCSSFLQPAAGIGSPAFRSRSRAAARRGEQLGPIACPGKCWKRFRARKCAGNGLGGSVAWVRFHPFVPFHAAKGLGGVSGYGSFLQHAAGNVSPAFRSRSRAAARHGERLGPVACPETCWKQLRARKRAGNGLGNFVAWVLLHLFVPFHAAKGLWFSFLGAVPFSSTRQGTFPLRFVAAHVLQHGAGNSWARLCARERAGPGCVPGDVLESGFVLGTREDMCLANESDIARGWFMVRLYAHGPEEGVPSTAARVAMEMRAEV